MPDGGILHIQGQSVIGDRNSKSCVADKLFSQNSVVFLVLSKTEISCLIAINGAKLVTYVRHAPPWIKQTSVPVVEASDGRYRSNSRKGSRRESGI